MLHMRYVRGSPGTSRCTHCAGCSCLSMSAEQVAALVRSAEVGKVRALCLCACSFESWLTLLQSLRVAATALVKSNPFPTQSDIEAALVTHNEAIPPPVRSQVWRHGRHFAVGYVLAAPPWPSWHTQPDTVAAAKPATRAASL